ncbi:hypothetical protein D3C84_1066460 [compost metagenome]
MDAAGQLEAGPIGQFEVVRGDQAGLLQEVLGPQVFQVEAEGAGHIAGAQAVDVVDGAIGGVVGLEFLEGTVRARRPFVIARPVQA